MYQRDANYYGQNTHAGTGAQPMLLVNPPQDQEEADENIGPGVRRQFHRTKLCKHFLKGNCLYGDECTYAHAEKDIQSRPDLRKTKMCTRFAVGQCTRGEKCDYAHTAEELRATNGIWKTTMCSWWLKGNCGLGEKCRFAHGEHELRPLPDTGPKPHSVPNVQRCPPGRNPPLPPSMRKTIVFGNNAASSIPAPAAPVLNPGVTPTTVRSPAPDSPMQMAVAAAAAAAATAAVNSMGQQGMMLPQQQAAVMAAATAAAQAAMSQSRAYQSVPWMPLPYMAPQAPFGSVMSPQPSAFYVHPAMAARPEQAVCETTSPEFSMESGPPEAAEAQAPSSPDHRDDGAASDAGSVLGPLPKASDLRGSTGNLNLLNMGFRKGFASSPALTTLLKVMSSGNLGDVLPDDESEGDEFPPQTIVVEPPPERQRADSDPTASAERAADELLTQMHAVQSESLLHSLSSLWQQKS